MNKKLLICDDDLGIIEMLELVLEDTGLAITTETDSTKMLPLIKKIRPDLILMDLWMPVCTGDQVLRQIKSDHTISEMPVLIMSAAQDGKEIALEAGANCYIAKPFDIDHLLTIIDMLMSRIKSPN